MHMHMHMRSTATHYTIAYSTYVHYNSIIQSKFTVQSLLYYTSITVFMSSDAGVEI